MIFLLSSRLRTIDKSRETGSAVPSRVSLLNHHTQSESDASAGFPLLPVFHSGASIYTTVNHHRVSPELIGPVTQ